MFLGGRSKANVVSLVSFKCTRLRGFLNRLSATSRQSRIYLSSSSSYPCFVRVLNNRSGSVRLYQRTRGLLDIERFSFPFGQMTMQRGKTRDIASFFGAKAVSKENKDADGDAVFPEDTTKEKLHLEDDLVTSDPAKNVTHGKMILSSSSDDEKENSSTDMSDEGDESLGGDMLVDEDEPEGVQKPKKKRQKSSSSASGGQDAIAANIDELISWNNGDPIPFKFLTDTFEKIADTTKRLEITSILTSAFRAIIRSTPGDLLPTVYLCTNKVSPAHEGVELGIGDATLIKALCQATGRKESVIKDEYDETGDLGIVAAHARASQKTMFKPKPLTIHSVLSTFKEIASSEGAKSQDRKMKLIIKLLAAASENEAGYLMRALQGKLRIGLAEQTVLVALAHAKFYESLNMTSSEDEIQQRRDDAVMVVKSVYSECPSYDLLIPALLEEKSVHDIPQKVHFSPGIPVKPMLAKPTTGVTEVLDKFASQPFTCEYKYDGERAQIHVLKDGTVKIYSRNSEDNTGKYPDIVAMFPNVLHDGVDSIVLDAEAVAYDPEEGKILPFQILSTRARKGVTLDSIKVHVCVFAFDCLYLNGKVLLKQSLTERREALYSAIKSTPGKMELATAKTSHDVEELSKFLDESVIHGTEGLIVKTLDDSYEPSKRSSHWLKLKKDYLDGVGDTFDLVPIGAWYGKGKRTGVYGSYLLAIWDPENEEFQVITKIGTGFSEELLKDLFSKNAIVHDGQKKKYYNCPDTLTPDVWFEPASVWEVKAADLSISPVYRAGIGLVDEGKGISIRFPRLVRVRDDKSPEDSTSPDQVADMYRSQASVNL